MFITHAQKVKSVKFQDDDDDDDDNNVVVVVIVIAAAVVIIIVVISFMQGIYTYIPETNYVPREYSDTSANEDNSFRNHIR